jgi:hypothetical protein
MSQKKPTSGALIKDLKRVQITLHGDDSPKVITRRRYRELGAFSERAWMNQFGTFQEFRRQAELEPNKQLRDLQGHVKKHSQVDHLRKLSKERVEWSDKYLRENSARYQLLLGFVDAHGRLADPFWLRVLLDTAHRAQPDIIVGGGDIYDNPEFSKFFVDPREFDIVAGLKFTNDEIWAPLRERCPDAQIDEIEGNHERRILKHITSNSPPTRVFLSDWLGLDVPKMLKLDEFGINYVAKSDLCTFTKKEDDEVLGKNYKVYFDCFLVHHYPVGRNKGVPGFNGHNHKHQVWMEYSHHHGPYEWHQVGCGHRRHSVYCDADPWQNGFVLAHIDTKDKVVNMEYIPVTNFACVGGKMYYRQKNEITTPGWK